MALFGSTWAEDSEDIGPFSHWNEETEDDLPIGRPIHEDGEDDYDSSIFFHFKD